MKDMRSFIVVFVALFSIALHSSASIVIAQSQSEIVDSIEGRDGSLGVPDNELNDSSLDNALNAVFLLAGGLAFVFVAVAGLRYVYSMGDPQQTQRAKDTLLYAIVGLVVTLSAFAIVRLVLGAL